MTPEQRLADLADRLRGGSWEFTKQARRELAREVADAIESTIKVIAAARALRRRFDQHDTVQAAYDPDERAGLAVGRGTVEVKELFAALDAEEA